MGYALSYWERECYFSNVDFTVVGAGIVGLHCALRLKEKFPEKSVLVLERGLLPRGASTKNAGFACFGSVSELLHDLNTHTEDEVFQLVEKRYKGLQRLKAQFGNDQIGYKHHNGYELFLKGDPEFYVECMDNRDRLNKLLYPIFKKEVFTAQKNSFGFERIQDHYIVNSFEGQIDTGKMMDALYRRCIEKNIKILYGVSVEAYDAVGNQLRVKTDLIAFNTSKLCLATNGFYQENTTKDKSVIPARAQVLITKPIQNLKIKGSFHLECGFYYFRNIANRILIGGGRNLDMTNEQTTVFGTTDTIQNKLEELLQNVVLPNTDVQIDCRWSGIMGVGSSKRPIVTKVTDHVFCGVRLGGMGIAIGSQVGEDLANLTMEYV